ncbi:MAG: gephyrin-like molybdotransferase Glp [Planctomycetota bacterium]
MTMLTLDDARALLADRVQVPAPTAMALQDATGCRLGAAVTADVSLPPSDVSAMDGYAARHAELKADEPFRVAFAVPAGAAPEALPPGAVARIFTGAMLPAGADTVVMQEDAVAVDDSRVRFRSVPEAGASVRKAGEVVRANDVLASAGELLTPQLIALLAAASDARISAWRRPAIAVLATGSELVPVGATPAPGQIRDSNSTMMAAFVHAAGLPLATRQTVGDDAATLQAALRSALEGSADIVICTGGVSVGDHDLVPDAVASVGGNVLLHGVRMKPGKPILVAQAGSKWIIGLPGNPVSAIAGWRLFAWPIARVLAGEADAMRESPVRATLAETVTNRGDRELLLPGTLDGGRGGRDAGGTVRPLNWKGSHDVATTARANALLRLDAGATHRVGDVVRCYVL